MEKFHEKLPNKVLNFCTPNMQIHFFILDADLFGSSDLCGHGMCEPHWL